jgi:hypothetical protein
VPTQPSPFGIQFDINISPNTTKDNVIEATAAATKNLELIVIVNDDSAKIERLQD